LATFRTVLTPETMTNIRETFLDPEFKGKISTRSAAAMPDLPSRTSIQRALHISLTSEM